MKSNLQSFRFLLNFLLPMLVASTALPASGDEDFGTQQSPTLVKWGGLRWKASERNLFQGRPRTTHDSDTTDFITIAYGRYVSYYDLKHFAPLWVAYATDKASWTVTTNRSRTGSSFDRPGRFFTDGIVGDASAALSLDPTEHEDYGDMVADGATGAEVVAKTLSREDASHKKGIIERGHLASNNTMKTWGSEEEGKKAQEESFSLANIVAEMRGHNSPTWSALEKQCLKWAGELGTVCVINGPIYKDRDHPRHIKERSTETVSRIPFPDALFCVVIGKRSGKTAAIGFIMPQQATTYPFKAHAVKIDEIEEATGIDFMPQMGEPNPLEESIDNRWLNN